MAEEIVTVMQKFMDFYSTQWSILANLFRAKSALHNLQSSSTDRNPEILKGHADVDEAITQTILTFNGIISEIGEYRDMTSDAFAFLSDDLNIAIESSQRIMTAVNDGYCDAAKSGVLILTSKLDEISKKMNQHLRPSEAEKGDHG